MQSFHAVPAPSFRQFGSTLLLHLRKNLPTTIIFAIVGAFSSWLINVYWIAKRYQGVNVPGGSPVTTGGNMMWGVVFWIIASTVIFGLIGHWKTVGTEQFLRDVRNFPTTVNTVFRNDGNLAWSHLLWGVAGSLLLAQIISPSLRGILGVSVMLTVPSVLGRILLGYVGRVWLAVTRSFNPSGGASQIPLFSSSVTGLGAAAALMFSFVADDKTALLIMAAAAAGGALTLGRRSKGSGPSRVTMMVFFWVAMVALGALGGARAASADDGGYAECGSSWSDWWGCDGASDVRSDAAVGAVTGALGGAIGSGLGSAMSSTAGSGLSSGGPSAGTAGGTGPDDPRDSDPTPADQDPTPVLDEFGRPILPNDEGNFTWDTPDGTELLGRDEIEERIDAARRANASRDSRHDSVVEEQTSDGAAEQRFDDLGERSIAENDAAMEEIRSGWDRVDELGAEIEQRDRINAAMDAAQAEQDLATLRDGWGQIFSDTAQASWSDATEIPGIVAEAGLDVLRAATNAENWRVLGESAAETAYDVAGLAAGNTFGDAQESIQQGAVTTGRVAVALGTQFVRHPVDTAAMFIPGRDFADALDGDRTLGQRLGSVGMGVLDIGATLAGAGVLSHADELVDAARAMDLAEDAAGAARVMEASGDAAATARAAAAGEDAASAARALGAAGDVSGQMAETVRLGEAVAEARDAARAAIASGNSADAARAMDAAAEAERAAEAARRSLFREGGMQGMGRAEAAGSVSDELAQGIVNMHDDITGAATRQGVVDAVDDFAAEVGFRPGEVMMGNSGSVGAGRSVLTDADRTIVASFTREQLEGARRVGESFTDTQRRLQGRLTELHQRAAELAMNSPTDPAVILARREGISLGDAVARLGDADDPTAAVRRLTGKDMDMASYSGFGSGAGQADAYPVGFTRARQATQGSTEVFTFGDRAGEARSYSTSGQAIIDRNELSQLEVRTWDTPNTSWGTDTTLGGLDMAADPTRIGNAEMRGLFNQQQQAMDHYNDVKSISKAVDRANYVAGRIGQPLPNQPLVDAARSIRANPRATQAVLGQIGMSESELVSNLQGMMSTYRPVFPT